MAEILPIWYIGEHNTKRVQPVTDELLNHAQDLGVSVSHGTYRV